MTQITYVLKKEIAKKSITTDPKEYFDYFYITVHNVKNLLKMKLYKLAGRTFSCYKKSRLNFLKLIVHRSYDGFLGCFFFLNITTYPKEYWDYFYMTVHNAKIYLKIKLYKLAARTFTKSRDLIF